MFGMAQKIFSSTTFIVSIGLMGLIFVGVVDYYTGSELGFSIFYLVPIVWLTGRVGRQWGSLSAVLGAAIWWHADSLSGRVYSHWWIPYWNGAVRCGVFLALVIFVSRWREALSREAALARRDNLTGIPNRQAFYELAERDLQRARREKKTLSLAYIDLDNFKAVNDNEGHKRGDEVLQVVANTLVEGMRTIDVAARLGGDEFVLFLVGVGEEKAFQILERIVNDLKEKMAEHRWEVTFSIGLITFRKAPGDVSEILHLGDDLMYKKKRQGKDGILHHVV